MSDFASGFLYIHARCEDCARSVTMSRTKAAHHRGSHQVTARAIKAAANADPTTRCQADNCKGRGNHTLAEHPPTKTGKPAQWTAGHINAGQAGGPYRPEADVCNYSDGATLGNRMRRQTTTRNW